MVYGGVFLFVMCIVNTSNMSYTRTGNNT